MLINSDVQKYFLKQAEKNIAEEELDIKPTLGMFWSYVSAIIGHGIVQYTHERDAYISEKSNISGLLGNDFLRKLHTFKDWQEAKKIWCGSREDLSDLFNRVSAAIWIPSQYVLILLYCTKSLIYTK